MVKKRDIIIAGNLEVPIMTHKVKNPNGLEDYREQIQQPIRCPEIELGAFRFQ